MLAALPLAHASGGADVPGWVRSAGVRTEAAARVAAWQLDGVAPSSAFQKDFPVWVQAQVVAAVRRHAVPASAACTSSVTVQFVKPGSVGSGDAERDFEQSTFRVESLHCLEVGNAKTAMGIYNSSSFREAVMPGLESYWRKGDDVCLATAAVTGVVGRTEMCMNARQLSEPGLEAFHTRLISSVDAPLAQGIFLRESVVTMLDRAEGGVAVHRVVYTRGKDLGSLQRAILEKVAGRSQTNIAEALQEQLAP